MGNSGGGKSLFLFQVARELNKLLENEQDKTHKRKEKVVMIKLNEFNVFLVEDEKKQSLEDYVQEIIKENKESRT